MLSSEERFTPIEKISDAIRSYNGQSRRQFEHNPNVSADSICRARCQLCNFTFSLGMISGTADVGLCFGGCSLSLAWSLPIPGVVFAGLKLFLNNALDTEITGLELLIYAWWMLFGNLTWWIDGLKLDMCYSWDATANSKVSAWIEMICRS